MTTDNLATLLGAPAAKYPERDTSSCPARTSRPPRLDYATLNASLTWTSEVGNV
jgi:hypothetical protein